MKPTFKYLLSVCLALVSLSASATLIPSYDHFGALPQATFGGTGIPNSDVAITTLRPTTTVFGHTVGLGTVTLGLTATARYNNQAVTDNGAGTFFATVGIDQHDSSSIAQQLARWNINFYVGGDVLALAQYSYRLVFDTNATGAETFKTLDIGLFSGGMQNSLNLGSDLSELLYGYDFNPSTAGQYSFRLEAVNSKGAVVGSDSIVVQVVPEPASLALFAVALMGLFAVARRRKA